MDTLDASNLPPGFGFHPTDVELISHYLKRKVLRVKNEIEVIPEVDIYKHEPWDLPAKSQIPSRECKWHFFNTRDRKYPNGSRSNRATQAGYWKSTGKDRMVRSRNRVIGTKKTLVFHEGRPPHGKRTDWIMHEFYLNDDECKAPAGVKDIFVLCRITKRDGLASEEEEVCTQVQKMNDPSAPSSDVSVQRTPEDGSESVEQTRELPSPTEDVNEIDDWLNELYDPNAVPALTECKIEFKVETSLLPPNNELGDLCFSPNVEHTLPTTEWGGLLYPQEIDTNLFLDAILQPDLEGNVNDWGHMDDGMIENTTHLSSFNNHEIGFAEYWNNEEERITALNPGAYGYPSNTNDTGIHIRRSRNRTSDEPSMQRIKLQVHKMEKNPVVLDHTVVFESSDHHIDLNEIPVPHVPKKPTASYHARDEIKKESAVKDTPPRRFEENYFHGRAQPEVRSKGAVPETRQTFSSKPFNPSLRGLVRRAFREARVLTRRYSSMGMNCLFLGTCLTGAAAWTGYVVHEDA